MTVKELREQLAQYSDDTEVWYFNEDDQGFYRADSVGVIEADSVCKEEFGPCTTVYYGYSEKSKSKLVGHDNIYIYSRHDVDFIREYVFKKEFHDEKGKVIETRTY